MTKTTAAGPGGRFAQIGVMTQCLELMLKAQDRPRHLPGIVVLSGYSGLGKSWSAAFTAAETGAVYIEARSTWTTKYFLITMARELGVEARGTIPVIMEAVVEALALQGRPLIIDEADHLVGKRYIEVIRDIYELSRAAVMLIGEQHFLDKIRAWERIDNRILASAQAAPATIADACGLRDLYCDRVALADDLLVHFLREVRGSVRRLVINLETAQQAALGQGLDRIDLAAWGTRAVHTGRPSYRTAAA